MERNYAKALFLAAGLMLFAMALTSFYSYYNNYQDYLRESTENIDSDHVIKSSWETGVEISGSEVAHFIRAKKKQEEDISLSASCGEVGDGVYAGLETDTVNAHENGSFEIPDVFFKGNNVMDMDSSPIDFSDSYNVRYDTDFNGNVAAIWYY